MAWSYHHSRTNMDKVYVLGGTGNVGTHVVQQLLAKNIPTTIYVRSASKAAKLFGAHQQLTTVEGPSFGEDDDFDTFKQSIQGHTRLFLLVAGMKDFVDVKVRLATIAFDSGIKQMVDISSQYVSTGWRTNTVGDMQRSCEEAVLQLARSYKQQRYVVTLRPSGFFTNHLWLDLPTIQHNHTIQAAIDPDERMPLISVRDVAAAATAVLADPVEKHEFAVYELTSAMLSANERAQILSRVLQRSITFQQIPIVDYYRYMVDSLHLPHLIAYGLASDTHGGQGYVTSGLPILLGRDPETLEEWLESVKDQFTPK
ncbi:hypothetical protein BCR42DRAFT_483707 [Absidia repens]|uniref:NmrA-like domain-containing protein n=1 Tax=Absidia repens TaxID=90262 RepID=A0A1X2IA85_9FUNG|nr:hypothetical protein BCR42DRAFT_483707 [Absidia repens]